MAWRVTLVLVLVVAAGAAYHFDLIGHLEGVGESVTRYRTEQVARGAITTVVTATGSVNAVVTTNISSQLSGQVAELLADFNDPVRQEQPLARLDPQSFDAAVREAVAELEMARAEVLTREAAIEKAEAEVTNARASRAVADAEAVSARAEFKEAERELNRRRALSRSAVVSPSDVEQAETRHKSTRALLQAARVRLQVRDAAILAAEATKRMAEAELQNARAVVKKRQAALDQARVDLARTVIRAPIDGIMIRRDVDVGTTVAASLQAPTLFTIAQDLSEIQVEAKVDEADIGRIRGGQPVAFTVDAHPGRRFAGTVEQIRKAHELFQNVVTYTVIVSAANRDLALFPGMTAIVRITVHEARDVVRIPNTALRYVPTGEQAPSLGSATESDDLDGMPGFVWVLNERDEPRPVPVRIGSTDSYFSAILSGAVKPGDQVVVGEITRPRESWFFPLR